MLPSGHVWLIEQARFTYSPLGKAFEKQIKTLEDQGRKQLDAILNWNKRLAAFTNEDDHKDNSKKCLKN